MSAKTFVALRLPGTPDRVFDVLVRDVDLWWKAGPRNRFLGQRPGIMMFDEQDGCHHLVEIDKRRPDIRFAPGRARIWQPGRCICLDWQWPQAQNEPLTQVDIRLSPAGDDATRLTLEHRGLETLSPAHPARSGLNDNRFKPMMAHYWRAHLISLRNRISHLHQTGLEAGIETGTGAGTGAKIGADTSPPNGTA